MMFTQSSVMCGRVLHFFQAAAAAAATARDVGGLNTLHPDYPKP